jgi:hypothetical protein
MRKGTSPFVTERMMGWLMGTRRTKWEEVLQSWLRGFLWPLHRMEVDVEERIGVVEDVAPPQFPSCLPR